MSLTYQKLVVESDVELLSVQEVRREHVDGAACAIHLACAQCTYRLYQTRATHEFRLVIDVHHKKSWGRLLMLQRKKSGKNDSYNEKYGSKPQIKVP